MSIFRAKRISRAWLCLVGIAAAGSADAQHPTWTTLYSSNTTASVHVVGDVNEVLQGRVKPSGFRRVKLRELLFAAGAGTVGGPKSVGEMMVVPERVHVKSVESPYRTESSKVEFSTPFCFALPNGARPKQVVRVEAPDGISLEQIHQELAARYGRTFAVAGMARFQSISSTALKRAPFYGEPISTAQNRDRYFHPVQTSSTRTGVFFGVVVNTNKHKSPAAAGLLERRMVYVNYADANRTALQSHSHVLLLSGNPAIPRASRPRQFLAAIRRHRPTEIRHLLTQSRITSALLLVYDIKRLTGR